MSDSASPPVSLLPCPFCGDEAPMLTNVVNHLVICGNDNCGAEGPDREGEVNAAGAWNHRTAITSHPLAEVTEAQIDAAMKAFGNTELVGSSFTRRAMRAALNAALSPLPDGESAKEEGS